MNSDMKIERDENLDPLAAFDELNKDEEQKISFSKGGVKQKSPNVSTDIDLSNTNPENINSGYFKSNNVDILKRANERLNEFDKGLPTITDDDKDISNSELDQIVGASILIPEVQASVDEIKKTKDKFSNYELTPNGLADANSPQVKAYKLQQQLIDEGIVKIPTTKEEEVELQKTLQEMSKEILGTDISSSDDILDDDDTHSLTIRKVKKPNNERSLDEIVNDAQGIKHLAVDEDDVVYEIEGSKGVISEVNPDIIQFNIDKENVSNFLTSLPDADRSKVQKAKSLIVNSIETKNVPVAKRTVTFEEYKKIVKSSKVETIARALPNSGYIAYFKPVGSLGFTMLKPETEDELFPTSIKYYSKRAKFCYDALVTTSLGDLSYDEFLRHTSYLDLPLMIHAILQISLPDKDKVTLYCTHEMVKGTAEREPVYCNAPLEVEYSLADLPDKDSWDEDLVYTCNELISVKDDILKAKEHHKKSIVMSVYDCVMNDTLILHLKSPDFIMLFDRYKYFDSIAEEYGDSIATLSSIIQGATVLVRQDENSEPEAVMVKDSLSIAEILYELSTDNLAKLKAVYLSIKEIRNGNRFSIKENIVCPKCGAIHKNPALNIDNLVFTQLEVVLQLL